MVKFMCLSQKQAITVAVAVILWMLLQRFVLLLPSLWDMVLTCFHRLLILIKRPPFIYIIFNFIIVYILLSPTFSFHRKFYKRPYKSSLSSSNSLTTPQPKPKSKHDFDDMSEISSSWESKDDTWWCQIVDDGEDLETVSFRGGVGKVTDNGEEGKMASFEVPQVEVRNSKADNNGEGGKTASFEAPQVENISKTEEEKSEEEGKGDDTLDATWKAIMEAKSGPRLKKSNTWSSSKRGNNNLGQYQVVELKKWQTFKKQSVKEKESGVGGGGGGGGGGWRRLEAVMMDHDDLKKRADAFIASFTHDIRLQRLESDQRFLDTINRGL